MEEKKNHPSLPSNYVSLALLRERWLQKQAQINHPQSQAEAEVEPALQNAQAPTKVALEIGTTSRSHPSLQYRVKSSNNLVTNHPSIVASTKDNRKSEACVGIEGETVNRNSEACELKKTKKNRVSRKPKKEEKGKEGVAAQGNKQKEAEKTAIVNELNGKKSHNSTMVEDVEQKFRDLATDSGNGKHNGRFKKGFRHSKPKRNSSSGRGYGNGRDKMVWVQKDSVIG